MMPSPKKLLQLPFIQNLSGQSSRRLVRQYFITSLILISGGLITSGLIELYYSYYEARGYMALLQQEKADSAALRIEQFVLSIEQGMTTAAKSRELLVDGFAPKFRFELERLLSVLPPITDLTALDLTGNEQIQVSRFNPEVPANSDLEKNRKIIQSVRADRPLKSYIGPVDFGRDSEPHLDIAVPVESLPGSLLGVLHADVDLRYVDQVMSKIKIGKAGHAYVVTHTGDLIAHPDMRRVPQRSNFVNYSQVQAAFERARAPNVAKSQDSLNFRKEKVFSSTAVIPRLNWAIIVEQPVSEVYETIYASMLRTSGLILLGFGIAFLASLYVARRVVRPLELLRLGVDRIGKGDLDHHLDIETGDEIEALANEFNKMTDALKQSYSGLEAKVNKRTQELRAANDRLEELNRLKTHFLSNVSHELRTPLTAVSSLVDNMLDGVTGALNEKQHHYLGGIRASGERLARLIDDLLNLAVIESGKVKFAPSRFSLSELVEDVTGSMRPLAQTKSVTLAGSITEGNHTAWADRDQITQVLTNLIDNAIKFTPPGGKIRLTISPASNDDRLHVSVSDTGPGIPSNERSQIFDEFYQISRPCMEKAKGAGLGLAISKKLVELNGGKISFESNNNGMGSRFTFTVPAHPHAAAAGANS